MFWRQSYPTLPGVPLEILNKIDWRDAALSNHQIIFPPDSLN